MAKPASRPARRGGAPVFTGVLIGLVLGAVLAVAVALWATGNNPFSKATPGAASGPATPPAASAAPELAPSFDFYKVLPGDTSGEMPNTQESAAQTPRYYLQAGAFQNAADADNLKAQLALLGLEAAIQTSDLAEKGTFHRVRIGPFEAMDAVERTRSLLAQNHIPATLVRENPVRQETP